MAIPFKQVCLPQIQGGLGLINPAHMSIASNGKIIARMLLLDNEIGDAFRTSLIETLLKFNLGTTELINGKILRQIPSTADTQTSHADKYLKEVLHKLSP
jgi:hypothetical protein